MQKDNHTCEPLGKCNKRWDDTMVRWLQMPNICTSTVSNNKDKVMKLEFFSTWRRVWLTCTNKSEDCINKHQCDTSPKHQQNKAKVQKFPSINNTMSGYESALCFMNCGLFIVVSKLWYQDDDSDSWLPCLIISTEIGLFTHNTLLKDQWQNDQYVI